jgi:hypothetical protein
MIRRRVTALVPLLLLALGGTARAQDVLVEGPGIKVGESTVLHPRIGLEAGVVSNVFYQDSDEVAAPIARLLAGIDIAPSGEDRLGEIDESSARTVDFRAGADVQYTEYLTSDETARDQRNLDAQAKAALTLFPLGNVAFAFTDQFQRIGRPTNFESTRDLDRDVNHFKAEMTIQPRGHNISGGPRYENTIDIFESDQTEFANRIQHVIGAKVNWKFFPYTQAWIDGSIGFYDALGDNTLEDGTEWKVKSRPVRVLAGLDTVLTESTTINAYAGWANGFYDRGPDYNSVIGGLDFGWRYVPTGKLVLGYRYDVHDSINANYYGEHQGKLSINQVIGTVLLTGMAGVRYRGYRGVPEPVLPEGEMDDSRDDLIIEGHFRAAWVLADRFSLYADYGLQVVDTDFETNDAMDPDPSYMRHEAVLGLIAAF